MRYAFGDGGTVLMPGRKYDLEKIIAATERVADILAFKLDLGKAALTTNRAGHRRFPWDEEAKGVARTFWGNAAEVYDAVDEPLVIIAGPITVRWYALGRSYVRYDGARDRVVDDAGEAIDTVDPQPCLVIYGEPNANLIAVVGEAVRPLCDRLGIDIWLANPGPMHSEIRIEGHVAVLRFPHGNFGDGDGIIRVRCVPLEGGSP